jgi:hypothetical protein
VKRVAPSDAYAGRDQVAAFEQLLDTAAQGVTCCCVCGVDGKPSTSGQDSEEDESGEGDDAPPLSFTVLTRVDFRKRSFALTRAGVS